MSVVAIVGAGGLGGPVALACAAAGARVAICDDDVVDVSNLQRQIQFTTADVGRAKVAALADAIAARGGPPARQVAGRFDASTADAIVRDAAVIVDASDDPATKFAVADWAIARRVPYVIAAAIAMHGSVMIGAPGVACYRCLFESPPDDAPTCGDAGVLGAAVGAIAGVAAACALALAAGDVSRAGSIIVFDDLRAAFAPRVVRFAPRPDCPTCSRQAA